MTDTPTPSVPTKEPSVLILLDQLRRELHSNEWTFAAEIVKESHDVIRDLYRALAKIEHDWDGEPEDMEEAREALRKARGES